MPVVICSRVVALQDLDLEGDWDPESHDRQMAGLYGEDEVDVDDKPQWDNDIDIGDIVSEEEEMMSKKKQKKKKRKKGKEPDDGDAGVDVDAMDADVERMNDDEEWDGTEEMRKRKLDEYMDEIYGLDFNDMASRFELCHMKSNADFLQIGDMPTRFKYTSVQPQSFALTPAEILMANDTELNQYLSVKKYAPYRKDNNWDKTRGDRLKDLKQSLAERSKGARGMGMSSGEPHQDVNGERVKKRKGKKERLKMKAAGDDVAAGEDKVRVRAKVGDVNGKRKHENTVDEAEEVQEGDASRKRKRRRHKKTVQE